MGQKSILHDPSAHGALMKAREPRPCEIKPSYLTVFQPRPGTCCAILTSGLLWEEPQHSLSLPAALPALAPQPGMLLGPQVCMVPLRPLQRSRAILTHLNSVGLFGVGFCGAIRHLRSKHL